MNDNSKDPATEVPLNPALKSTTDTTHDTTRTSPAPIDTTSAKEGEGEGWPLIWLAVGAVCLLVTVYLIF